MELTKEIVHKAAFLRIDKIKSCILKAICSQYRVNYRAFDSKEKAVEFLTND